MRLKAGRYWVGDLCYIIDRENWNTVCKFLGDGSKMREGVFDLLGRQGAIFGTAYGDGGYYDQEGNEYGVDSGTLGIFPAGVFSSPTESGGHIFDFPEDFTVECINGEMRFGRIRIPTKGAACPIFRVKVRRKNGEERIFDLDVVEDCYFKNSNNYPGVRIANPSAVNEFCGDFMASEMIGVFYAEANWTSGEQENEDEDELFGHSYFAWEMIDEAGDKVEFEAIESAVFDHFLVRR